MAFELLDIEQTLQYRGISCDEASLETLFAVLERAQTAKYQSVVMTQ